MLFLLFAPLGSISAYANISSPIFINAQVINSTAISDESASEITFTASPQELSSESVNATGNINIKSSENGIILSECQPGSTTSSNELTTASGQKINYTLNYESQQGQKVNLPQNDCLTGTYLPNQDYKGELQLTTFQTAETVTPQQPALGVAEVDIAVP